VNGALEANAVSTPPSRSNAAAIGVGCVLPTKE
jgi:hypothetical protein